MAIRNRGYHRSFSLLIWLTLSWPGASTWAQWVNKVPSDLVTLDSGRRNPVFYVGQPITFTVTGQNAVRYTVRDYWGNTVEEGPAGPRLALKPHPPGWYKLDIYGRTSREPWGDASGSTMFVVFRSDPNFPLLPSKGTPGGSYYSFDEPLRGVIGIGPQRLFVADASKPQAAIKALEADIALNKRFYLPFDPVRNRALMVAFPNGTRDLAGVRQIVERFKNDVRYWEPRNEPNSTVATKGAYFAIKEMKPFYETVKSVDPSLKVMGPGTVTIGPNASGLDWIRDFLKAGGGKYIDVFSFHAYNNVNGDLWLARQSLETLNNLLQFYGAGMLEKWQTEQGYFAAMYGVYDPGHQGRWTMLQMMVYEQFGIPKEHNCYFYDRSHGYWDFPTWWVNDDGGLNPAAPLMRVWSEELYGTNFVERYSFGEPGDKLYIGSRFESPDKNKRIAVFMSAGSTDGRVQLKVTGGSKLRLTSAFGVERDLPVEAGLATLPVPELPVYVELDPGQSIEVVPTDWGPNLARSAGVTAAASGTGKHPMDRNLPNSITKIINGRLENWYWSQQPDAHPWMDDTKSLPAWVEVRLPRPAQVARVIVYATPLWQWQGTLLDYELQYENNGQWVTLERVQEPPRTFKVFTPTTRTWVDTFHSGRWIFQHPFDPVTTQKIRLLVHEVTYGGGATAEVQKAGGQTGPQRINLREVEIYGR